MADEKTGFKLDYIKYGLMLLTIILIPIMFEFALKNKNIFDKTYGIIILLVFIPLLCILGYEYFFLKKPDTQRITNYLLLFVLATVLVSIFYSQLAMYSSTFTYVSYFFLGLSILILLVGLTIIFFSFTNYFKSLEGTPSFISYFIFYIPCLILDFVKYVIKEFQLTTKPIYILLVLEVLLILAYVYIPKLLERISKKEGVPVIEESVFLDQENSFSLNEEAKLDLTKQVKNIYTGQDIVKSNRLNYSLSMWLYVNNYDHIDTDNIEETNILNFNNGLPKLTLANSNAETSKIYAYYTNANTDEQPLELLMPYQKWNNIVFNYFSTHVDIFINGNLEKSISLNEENFPIYNNSDYPISNEVITGGNREITGAICNVRYYKENLSERKIVNFYNLLKNKNPPTFNM